MRLPLQNRNREKCLELHHWIPTGSRTREALFLRKIFFSQLLTSKKKAPLFLFNHLSLPVEWKLVKCWVGADRIQFWQSQLKDSCVSLPELQTFIPPQQKILRLLIPLVLHPSLHSQYTIKQMEVFSHQIMEAQIAAKKSVRTGYHTH